MTFAPRGVVVTGLNESATIRLPLCLLQPGESERIEKIVYRENSDPDDPPPFRLCERCGQPTPGNLPQCVNCGAISLHAVVSEEQARAERQFARALFSRATPVTYALLAVNIGVFVVMAIVSRGSDDPATLIAFGAKTNELLRSGEWF